MADSFRVQVAEAIVDLLEAVDFGESVAVARSWVPRRSLTDGCVAIYVIPQERTKSREDLAQQIEVYRTSIVVQAKLPGEGIQPDGDEARADELDRIAEIVSETIDDNELLTVGSETLDRGDIDISEHDEDDWTQRRTYTAQVSVQYTRRVTA